MLRTELTLLLREDNLENDFQIKSLNWLSDLVIRKSLMILTKGRFSGFRGESLIGVGSRER